MAATYEQDRKALADALQQVRRESAAAYAACYESRAGLINWIRGE